MCDVTQQETPIPQLSAPQSRPHVSVCSFGFKYGVPPKANWVFDVRFMDNPYWVPELRQLTGQNPLVAQFVLQNELSSGFVDSVLQLMDGPLKLRYEKNLERCTIAVGCTGGKHRSVAVVEALAQGLQERGFEVEKIHLDLGRE